jgi:DNA mismatch repair protein MutH
MGKTYLTKTELITKAKELEGTTFGEYDVYRRLEDRTNKGALGQVIEEGFFEYQVNSRSEPDFVEAGVELKVTPFRKNRNGTFSSKERLVLNMIDYMGEDLYVFENSSFWKKNATLLIVFYLYEADVPVEDFEIVHTLLWDYSGEDLEVIKADWRRIVGKIRRGLAHEISEGDTLYLGACRKGHKDSKKVQQPFSEVPAHRRAYSLKQSYMTSILRNHAMKKAYKKENILPTTDILLEQTFEDYLLGIFQNYYGRTVQSLFEELEITTTAKHKLEVLLSKILKLQGSITKTEEYIKGGYQLKTVRINIRGGVTESMSFPQVPYFQLANESWEESSTKEMFENTRFMFAVFRETPKDYVFERVVFHSISEEDVETQIREVYETTRSLVLQGKIVKEVLGGRYFTHFPTKADNPISHVRPHAANRKDTYPLPVPDQLTGKTEFVKMCFWLNNDYIRDIVTK